MTFHVGQKVVCIDDRISRTDGRRELHKDQVYTVAWYGSFCGLFYPDAYRGIRLHEIGPRICPILNVDVPFNARRFRPLVERKSSTDIRFALDILDRVAGTQRTKEPAQ
jgi:hypothetical protein